MEYIFSLLNNNLPIDSSNYNSIGKKIFLVQCFLGLIISVVSFFSILFFYDDYVSFAGLPLAFSFLTLLCILSKNSNRFYNYKVFGLLYIAFFSLIFTSIISHSAVIPLLLIPISFSFFNFLTPNYKRAASHFALFMLTGGFLALFNYLYFPESFNFTINLPIGCLVILLSTYKILLFVFIFNRTIELFKERTAQFNKAQDIANLGSFEYNVQTNKLIWSDGLYKIYGQNPDTFEASFETFMSQLHPDDRDRFQQTIQKAMQTGSSFTIKERVIRPDGTERKVSSIGSVELNEQGLPVKVNGVCRDITEEEETEIALEQSQNRYRTLFDHAFDGILIFDINTHKKIDCNDKLCTYFGLSSEYILNSDSFDFLTKDNTACPKVNNVFENLNRALYDESPLQFECAHLQPNGKEFFSELTIIKLPVPNQDLGVLLLKDITNKKIAAAQLNKSKQQFQSIFETNGLGIAIADTNNRIIRTNKAYASYLGYTPEELKGISFLQLTHPDFISKNKTDLKTLFEGDKNKTISFDKKYIRKDGQSVWVRLWVRTFEEDGEPRYLATIQDVSEHKKWKQAITSKNEELQKYIASNLQLESFAYVASHDLKAPLRTIISFSQFLKRKAESKLDTSEKEYLDFIIKATHNLNDLIEALLLFSTVDSNELQLKPVNASALLQTIVHELKADIEKNNVEILIHNLPDILVADITQLRQLFQNLISNSIKFKTDSRQPTIIINALEKEDSFQFSIADNGIGIKPEYLDKIFLMFRKLHTSNEFEGTGIGLSVCKKIVEQHDGKIWAESTFGKGTTFYFTIAKKIKPKTNFNTIKNIKASKDVLLSHKNN